MVFPSAVKQLSLVDGSAVETARQVGARKQVVVAMLTSDARFFASLQGCEVLVLVARLIVDI